MELCNPYLSFTSSNTHIKRTHYKSTQTSYSAFVFFWYLIKRLIFFYWLYDKRCQILSNSYLEIRLHKTKWNFSRVLTLFQMRTCLLSFLIEDQPMLNLTLVGKIVPLQIWYPYSINRYEQSNNENERTKKIK